MRSIGLRTVILYLASLVTFALAIQFANFFTPGLILGAVLFIAATIILLMTVRKRFEKQNF